MNKYPEIADIQQKSRVGQPWMRVYLDDDYEYRVPDDRNVIWVTTVENAIGLLLTRQVAEIDLDNDLQTELEGRYVLDWLEEYVALDPTFPIPTIIWHSANISAGIHVTPIIIKLEEARKKQLANLAVVEN